MKHIKLSVLSFLALLFGAPIGFRTANANDKGVNAGDSTTELLCKGAGVDPDDVYWRVRAGLSPKQAVEVAQQEKLEKQIEAYDKKHHSASVEDLRKSAEKAGLQPGVNMSRQQLIVLIVQSGKAVTVSNDETDSDESDLDSMTVADLKSLAQSKGVEVAKDMKKADIIAAIEAAK